MSSMPISTEHLNQLARQNIERLMTDPTTNTKLSMELSRLSLSSQTLNEDLHRLFAKLKIDRKGARK